MKLKFLFKVKSCHDFYAHFDSFLKIWLLMQIKREFWFSCINFWCCISDTGISINMFQRIPSLAFQLSFFCYLPLLTSSILPPWSSKGFRATGSLFHTYLEFSLFLTSSKANPTLSPTSYMAWSTYLCLSE